MENSQWFEASLKGAWVDDLRLQQNEVVKHATREHHNMFGTNLLGTQGAICKTTNIEFEKQTQALNVQIQDWNGKMEMVKLQMSKPTPIPFIRMDNSLK